MNTVEPRDDNRSRQRRYGRRNQYRMHGGNLQCADRRYTRNRESERRQMDEAQRCDRRANCNTEDEARVGDKHDAKSATGRRVAAEADECRGERIKALEREVRELRQANEILRQASAYFAVAELDRRRTP